MTRPTQMVVGKGIPNLLITKGLLKILRDPISFWILSPWWLRIEEKVGV